VIKSKEETSSELTHEHVKTLDIDFDENEPMEERFLLAAAAWPGSGGVRGKIGAHNDVCVELLERMRENFEKVYGPSSVRVCCASHALLCLYIT